MIKEVVDGSGNSGQGLTKKKIHIKQLNCLKEILNYK